MYGSGKFDVAPAPPVPQLCASYAHKRPSALTPALMCAVADPAPYAAVWLEADVRDEVRGVRGLDDVARLVEAGVEVALFFLDAFFRVPAFEHRRPISGHCLIRGRQMRQRFVGHFDQPRGIGGVLFSVGRDSSDRIALIHHLRARIFPTDRDLATRRCLRGSEINGNNPSMRMRG